MPKTFEEQVAEELAWLRREINRLKIIPSSASVGAASTGAPNNLAYVVTQAASEISNDRVLAAGSGGVVVTDQGAGASVLVTLDQSQVSHDNLAGVSANDHHNQSHVLATTSGLGPDHTTSGLTAGMVLRAAGATSACMSLLNHTDLISVSKSQHHTALIGLLDIAANTVGPASATDRITFDTDGFVSASRGTTSDIMRFSLASPFIGLKDNSGASVRANLTGNFTVQFFDDNKINVNASGACALSLSIDESKFDFSSSAVSFGGLVVGASNITMGSNDINWGNISLNYTPATASTLSFERGDNTQIFNINTDLQFVINGANGASAYLGGAPLYLDADSDSSVTTPTDDNIVFKVSASELLRISTSGIKLANTGATVNDIDTSMAASPTDSQLLTAQAVQEYVDNGGWQSWTPTVTQSGAVAVTVTYARYKVTSDGMAAVEARLAVTGTGTIGNVISIGGQPSAIQHANGNSSTAIIGTGIVQDAGTAFYQGALISVGATDWRIMVHSGTNYIGAFPNIALASGDSIGIQAVFES